MRSAERIVDIGIGVRCEVFRERRIVGCLFRVESNVLKEQDIAIF